MAQYEQFGELLNQHLGKQERTQSWLARQLSCDPTQVSRWINNGQRPGNKELVWEIGRVLELPEEDLDDLLLAADYPPRSIGRTLRMYSDVSRPAVLMNMEQELEAFRKILLREDTETRFVSIYGDSGMGKTRLIEEYKQLVRDYDVRSLSFYPEESDLTVEGVLYQVVCEYGLHLFPGFNEAYVNDKPKMRTQDDQSIWWRKLTMSFFLDLKIQSELAQLVLFIDKFEKADRPFRNWMNQEFLPGILGYQSVIMVIAGQEKAAYNPKKEGLRIFHLNGLSVDWFKSYAKEHKVPLGEQEIQLLHTVLRGCPRNFCDYIHAQVLRGAR
jgi:hypothetical protein